MRRLLPALAIVIGLAPASAPLLASDQGQIQYRVLATSRTSTLERELNQAADEGFRFAAVMGGETALAGNEVVAVVERAPGMKARYQYRLLATSRTSTMQRELQLAADAGFEYIGQPVFESTFGGQEVVCILERDGDGPRTLRHQYLLLATSRTATMQKELQQAGADGFSMMGLTVGKTAIGGNELVAILRRPVR
jgi:hypothetical protein